MTYKYDRKNDIIIQMPTRQTPLKVISKDDNDWVNVPNKDYKYESYGEAIYFGEGNLVYELEDISIDKVQLKLLQWNKQKQGE